MESCVLNFVENLKASSVQAEEDLIHELVEEIAKATEEA